MDLVREKRYKEDLLFELLTKEDNEPITQILRDGFTLVAKKYGPMVYEAKDHIALKESILSEGCPLFMKQYMLLLFIHREPEFARIFQEYYSGPDADTYRACFNHLLRILDFRVKELFVYPWHQGNIVRTLQGFVRESRFQYLTGPDK